MRLQCTLMLLYTWKWRVFVPGRTPSLCLPVQQRQGSGRERSDKFGDVDSRVQRRVTDDDQSNTFILFYSVLFIIVCALCFQHRVSAFNLFLQPGCKLKLKSISSHPSRTKEGRSNIRTGSAAYFWLIGFLVNFLCIVAPPVGTRSRRVRFVFFYRMSYVGLAPRQHLATVIRYADCVKQRFRPSRRRLVANYTSFITRLLWLWSNSWWDWI